MFNKTTMGVRYHTFIAKHVWKPMCRDKYKITHPALYSFGDKMWRHHANKALDILKTRMEEG